MSSDSSSVRLETRQVGAVTVVAFPENTVLTGQLAQAVGVQLAQFAEDQHHLLLDFGNVESLTSMMISTLLLLHGKLQAAGGRLALCQARPFVREVLDLVKFTWVVPVYGDEAEALQSFDS